MSQNKNLVIINNEKVSQEANSFYCDNIDMKAIPEGLSNKLEVLFIGRKSIVEKFHKINLKRIIIKSNIFSFLFAIFKTFKNKETNYLLISISPYTFFSYLFLFIFRKKIFIYLRSNGYEEYKAILGFIGPIIYHVMYIFVTFGSKIIVCQKRLAKNRESNLVFPSELDYNWLENTKKAEIDIPKLLYVGRIKVEKGIFSLIKIFNQITIEAELTIVGKIKNIKKNSDKINLINYCNNTSELVKIYDNHNIIILPSFTEAHPKVIDESLARKRPVIVFNEISHVIQNRSGVFVSKRNINSLIETIEFIMKNYLKIQNDILKNKLPTKQSFISQMIDILR